MVGKAYNPPASCRRGSKFDIQHSMICRKNGFLYIQQYDLRDLTSNIMSEVCKDTEIEPKVIIWKRTPRYNVKQFKRGKGRYQDSRLLGTRKADILTPDVIATSPCSSAML